MDVAGRRGAGDLRRAKRPDGRRLLNEFRLLVGHEAAATRSLHLGPHVVVLDAFSGGGAQADQTHDRGSLQSGRGVDLRSRQALFKAGFQVPDFSRRGFDDRSNREGTFTFSSLADYSRWAAALVHQQQGDGRLVFLQKVFGAFLQDQINVNDRLVVHAGHPIRLAEHLYRQQQCRRPSERGLRARQEDGAPRRRRRLLRSRRRWPDPRSASLARGSARSIILLNPGYPDPFGSGAAGATARSIVTLDPSSRFPLRVSSALGIERMLRKGTTVAFNYLGSRGVDLFRSRDINAPPPPLYLSRPDPAFGQIRQIESTARQTTHSVQA